MIQAIERGGNAIIESFRAIGEVHSAREIIKKLAEENKKNAKFILLDVESDAKSRYERVIKRGSHLDKVVSFDEFLAHDKREADSEEEHRGNIQGCKRLADFKIENNGSFEELENKVKSLTPAQIQEATQKSIDLLKMSFIKAGDYEGAAKKMAEKAKNSTSESGAMGGAPKQ